VRIAYCAIGTGFPVIWHGPFVDQMLAWFEASDFKPRLQSLPDRRIVRYDGRGTGLSQRKVEDFSLDARLRDLSAVVEALDLEKFDLMGNLWSAPLSIAYAAANQAKVRRLLLLRPYSNACDVAPPDRFESLVHLCRTNWPLACEVFFGLANTRAALARPFQKLLVESATGDTVATWLEQQYEVDVSNLLASVRAPTLVMHCRDDRAVRVSLGRAVAASISDARFIELPGDDYGTTDALNQSSAFLTAHDTATQPVAGMEASRTVTTVLVTDLVDHTHMMQRLGDEQGRAVLREHERITRALLRDFRGTEVKTMGDGFIAAFDSVTRAMDCAVALQRALAGHADADILRVRVGLNAGEPIIEDGDMFGATMIMASRICGQAGAGEILIPEPLRHLLAGKRYEYADRGTVRLKGFEEAVRLYRVQW
jgi:class 3 adenylate cyclase/pimeloyl-ACP methyl ester carboxylesterase